MTTRSNHFLKHDWINLKKRLKNGHKYVGSIFTLSNAEDLRLSPRP